MAALRGWARSSSTAAKLATVEQIIGYRFKSAERLYEALDLEKQTITLSNGQERSGRRPRNTRLALVGDSAAKFNFACQWYARDLNGIQWIRIHSEALCNDNLGDVGFAVGLDELTVPESTKNSYAMASTVEAILGAVHLDGGEDALSRVMGRLGITHRLFDSPERAWVHEPVRSRRNLPARFFLGHQWNMQKLLFNANPSLLPRGVMGEVARLPLNEALLRREAGGAYSHDEEGEPVEEKVKIDAEKAKKRAERRLDRVTSWHKRAEAKERNAAALVAMEEKRLLQLKEVLGEAQMEAREEADAMSQIEVKNDAEIGGEKKFETT